MYLVVGNVYVWKLDRKMVLDVVVRRRDAIFVVGTHVENYIGSAAGTCFLVLEDVISSHIGCVTKRENPCNWFGTEEDVVVLSLGR